MHKSISELHNLLQRWYDEMLSPNYKPLPIMIKLCELFETESQKYFKEQPDPFDGCYPFRNPSSVLSIMYWIIIRNDLLIFLTDFIIEHYTISYNCQKPIINHDLSVAACRLTMNLIPGLEFHVVSKTLKNEKLIKKLFTWAKNANEPLQTYATGLLASCMKSDNITTDFKKYNNKLLPTILDRVHSYYIEFCEENEINQSTQPSPKKKSDSNSSAPESNARNWIQIYPLTLTTKLVYCLKYLVTIGKFQEFLSHAYDKNALNLIMIIINSSENQNGYLTLEALKYLAALLRHKKFAIEFIGSQGLQKLLLIPKPSIPSNGVSICFKYLSCCEEVMEKICLLPEHVLVDLVKYALWMLDCSNDSSRCNAIMFFSNSFHLRTIQEIFDNHDGLHKLINRVSALPINLSESMADNSMNENDDSSTREIIHHFCAGLKLYIEAHLHIKAQEIRKAKMRDSGLLISTTMSTKKSRAEVQEEIELLLNDMSLKNHWTPVDQLLELGGLNLLLQIISVCLAKKYCFSERYKIIENALEVINICAVLPKVQLTLCEISSPLVPADNQNGTFTVEDDPEAKNNKDGLRIILEAAEEDSLNADIRKIALSVIIKCLCAPIHMEGGSVAYSSHGSNKKQNPNTVIEKVWDTFRNNNGITVLLTLITIKTPITEVDVIRGLAIRALGGLARNGSARQILSKLPLFNSGQLQNLMRNPVLQEKLEDHVTFQKYAIELLKLVSEEYRANVDAQQLNLFLYQFLMEKGMSRTAELLVQETNLCLCPISVNDATCDAGGNSDREDIGA